MKPCFILMLFVLGLDLHYVAMQLTFDLIKCHVNIPANSSLPDTLPPSSHRPILTRAAAASDDAFTRSSKRSSTAAPAHMAARSAPTAATQSAGSAHRPGQRLSAQISARCMAVLPCVETATPGSIGNWFVVVASGSVGEARRRTRSSMRRPAMRMAKRSGGDAARRRAVWDCGDAFRRWWCGVGVGVGATVAAGSPTG